MSGLSVSLSLALSLSLSLSLCVCVCVCVYVYVYVCVCVCVCVSIQLSLFWTIEQKRLDVCIYMSIVGWMIFTGRICKSTCTIRKIN